MVLGLRPVVRSGVDDDGNEPREYVGDYPARVSSPLKLAAGILVALLPEGHGVRLRVGEHDGERRLSNRISIHQHLRLLRRRLERELRFLAAEDTRTAGREHDGAHEEEPAHQSLSRSWPKCGRA